MSTDPAAAEAIELLQSLLRFDTGGLGLSDPLPPGTEPSIEAWGRDGLAVMAMLRDLYASAASLEAIQFNAGAGTLSLM